jgi:hypothetical protein
MQRRLKYHSSSIFQDLLVRLQDFLGFLKVDLVALMAVSVLRAAPNPTEHGDVLETCEARTLQKYRVVAATTQFFLFPKHIKHTIKSQNVSVVVSSSPKVIVGCKIARSVL